MVKTISASSEHTVIERLDGTVAYQSAVPMPWLELAEKAFCEGLEPIGLLAEGVVAHLPEGNLRGFFMEMTLRRCRFSKCSFSRTSFALTIFDECHADGCIFIDADMGGSFTGSRVEGSEFVNWSGSFSDSLLIRTSIEGGHAFIGQNVNMAGCIVSGASLNICGPTSGFNAEGAELRDCAFIGAAEDGARPTFLRPRLQRADLRGTRFVNPKFISPDFRGADLSGAYIGGVEWVEPDLRGARMECLPPHNRFEAPHLQRAKIQNPIVDRSSKSWPPAARWKIGHDPLALLHWQTWKQLIPE